MSAGRNEASGSRSTAVDQATATDMAYWGAEIIGRIADTRTASLLHFWADRAGQFGAAPPPRDAFAVEDLRPWIGALSLWDHVGNETGYICRLYGSLIAQRLEQEMTGHPVADYPLGLARAMRVQLDLVLELSQPVLIKIDRPRMNDRVHDLKVTGIEKLFLPLTRSGDRLDCVLCWYSYLEAPESGS